MNSTKDLAEKFIRNQAEAEKVKTKYVYNFNEWDDAKEENFRNNENWVKEKLNKMLEIIRKSKR